MKKNYLIFLSVIVVLFVGAYLTKDATLGGVSNYLDTSSSGFTTATSSVGVYSATNLFTSVTKGKIVQNIGDGTLYCKLDATGTIAASSTVASAYGLVIGANNTTSTVPSIAQFGECYPGALNCFPHKGSVNCITNATSTVIVQTR